jgi:RHH-type proline utilization regulon transcriptional repressor/proline dehydrogenase/delta 1-pyrroline-5-carboxylate dehydrogenase
MTTRPPFADFAPHPRTGCAAPGDHRRLSPARAGLHRRAAAASHAADAARAEASALARRLVEALRARPKGSGVDQLVQEFALSTQEGVALMCLAEALLRIPDDATRDALIRDKIAGGDWRAHIGGNRSLFVNAATWGWW